MVSARQQSKHDQVDSIINNLLDNHVKKNDALLRDPKAFSVISAEKNIEKLLAPENNDDAAIYYATKGIIYAIKGQYVMAKDSYERATRLQPNSPVFFSNYSNVLISGGFFEKAKEQLESYFSKGGSDYTLLKNLFFISAYDLDFSLYKKYFNHIEEKKLSLPYKDYLDKLYTSINSFDSLVEDLVDLDISIELYSEFYKLLSVFYSKRLYGNIDYIFQSDYDDKNLNCKIYTNLSDEQVLKLTSEFEEYIVNYAIRNENSKLLSKFVLFFENESNPFEEYNLSKYFDEEV